MSRRPIVLSCWAAALVALATAPADAGQVRVAVGSGGLLFAPRAANVNPGDHVVWIWSSGTHTVTSGDSSTATPDGVFDSNLMTAAGANTAAFSWRSMSAGTQRYYCEPHAPTMAGRVIAVASPPVPVADLRITEIRYGGAAATDLIEITNLGGSAGDLGRYRLALNGVAVPISSNSFPVPVGVSVVVHCVAGTNTATDLFLAGLGDLPDAAGTLALYVPNTTIGTTLNDATQMIDFVKWGDGATALEAIATGNGYWSAGTVPTVGSPDHSIAFCGVSGAYGPAEWSEVSLPTFGTAGASNCTTPAANATWGRIKALYR